MSATSFLFPVQSVGTVNFLPALAAAAGTFTPPFAGTAINTINGVPPIGSRRFLIRAISWTAVENIGLEFDFYSRAAGGVFLGRYQFASVNGVQLNGAGLFNYYVDGLALPYFDDDTINTINPPTLHVAAQNIDTVAKSANAAGAVVAIFWLEPQAGVQG